MSIDLKKPYAREDYIDFFQNNFLPNDFELLDERIDFISKPSYLQHAHLLGKCDSLNLKVYELEHKSEYDPRVSITRETFKLMTDYVVNRALIIFKSTNSKNYRLSLTILDMKLEGKKIIKKPSNPRRYSFFLGPDSKIHTPNQYLIVKGRVKDFTDLESRFSIEVVNKDFYNEIAIAFTKLVGGERKIGTQKISESGSLKLPDTTNHKKLQEFAVRLIGRLVFCWFLKKKISEDGVPLIPNEVLSSESIRNNYYHDILENLFFQVLNKPMKIREEEFKSSPWNIIPFLNGGLFEEHDDDYYLFDKTTSLSKNLNTLKVPDDWIRDLLKAFELYNFTIDENTSMDVELSVEPEMLGRIFENLLAEINPETGETARKATGSYYTPRPIVEYMVDESLKRYMSNTTSIDDDDISSLLKWSDETHSLTEEEIDQIIDSLDSLKVLDPACGSGAFPMGFLQKILLILQKIDPQSLKWLVKKLNRIQDVALKEEMQKKLIDENWDYIHKLGIIQNSIYGVDIQPIAVEISKLRFFLSLVVNENVNDSEKNRGIKPLPNLEFRFVCANSLFGLKEKLNQESFSSAQGEIETLKKLRSNYFNSIGEEKKRIENKFSKVQNQMFTKMLEWYSTDDQAFTLSTWEPFSFKPANFFSSPWMFGVDGGFDVIIGNPPFGFRNVLTTEDKKYFRKTENIEFSSGDSAELFSIKCFNELLKQGGILTFIIPKKSLYGEAWSGWRTNYWKKYSLFALIDSSKAFENVLLEQVVYSMEKTIDQESSVALSRLTHNDEIKEFARDWKSNIFMKNNTIQIYKSLFEQILIDKIEEHKVIDSLVEGELGLAIGKDFFSDVPTDHKLLKGIDISRWTLKQHRYLKNKENLKWEKAKNFLKPKVICQRLIAHIENPSPHLQITACYDSEGIIIANTLTTFRLNKLIKEKFWLGYLNSTFVSWYAYNFIYSRAIRTMDFYNFYIQQIPIPKIIIDNPDKQESIIDLVNQILKTKKENFEVDTTAIEDEIDQIIYDFYALTQDEVAIIRAEDDIFHQE